MLTVSDFFCGAGGFSEGFYQAGFNVIFALDNWKPAKETHDFNHPDCKCELMNILKLDTIEKIDEVIPDTDIIIGSPPCVSFSSSNKAGKADKTLGVQLIEQYLKIILHKKTKPNSILKYWIMENVPNSLEHVKDVYTAEKLGLDSSLPNLEVKNKQILVASNYGSPQGRKRAICGDYIIPEITHTEDTYIHTSKILDALGCPLKKKRVINDPSFKDIKLKSRELSDHFYDTELPPELYLKAKRLKTDHGFMGKMDFPDRLNRLCRTIMATEAYSSREAIIFPKEGTDKVRAPTIREISCLMGFPINYQFVGNNTTTKHKQIGNAVCVHLSKALAEAIKKDMKISLTRKPRENKIANINLNGSEPLFLNKTFNNVRKMNSKFSRHVPEIKIDSLRVELDNLESDFETEKYKWNCYLHKGSGKKSAQKCKLNNDIIKKVIEKDENFKDLENFIEEVIKPNINNSILFQIKNCNIEDDREHYSPEYILDEISKKIKSFEISNDEKIEVKELDKLLKYKPTQKNSNNSYPKNIIYSLYLTNSVVSHIK